MDVYTYRDELVALLASLDLEAIERGLEVLRAARSDGATVFVAGNGGSAATASHMVTDLMFGRGLPEPGLRVVGLADNQAIITATANDVSYSDVFSRQIRRLGQPDDVAILISASGDSESILAAAVAARSGGLSVIGLTGFDGGRLRSLCDVCIHVPTPAGAYGLVEDVHLVINHMLVAALSFEASTTTASPPSPPPPPRVARDMNDAENQDRPFIDFYREHGVIPVNYVRDQGFLARRAWLSATLGVPPALIRGSDVLEFGPGTGDNALVTASFGPNRYVLVDANPASLAALRERFPSGGGR